MKTRYLFGGVAVFGLLLVTLLGSMFGWGLPTPTAITTMATSTAPETAAPSHARFHLWHMPARPKVGNKGT